jgi:hypothetical protein
LGAPYAFGAAEVEPAAAGGVQVAEPDFTGEQSGGDEVSDEPEPRDDA